MAWDFAAQIHALTGLDADNTSTSETGETYVLMVNRWLEDAAKEVINLLPAQMLQRCAKASGTNGTANYTNGTGVTHHEKVISAIRTRNTESTPQFDNPNDVFVCREIPFLQSHKASDPDSLEYATETDPVFYYEPQPDGTSVLIKVLPSSSAAIAKVYSVDYPTMLYTNIKIDNFPDEAENLVVLRAAITAAEYQLAIEEDVELYGPIIGTLKTQYQEAIMALKTGNVIPPPQQPRAR